MQSIVGQLQRERTRLEDELHRITGALTAFGNAYMRGGKSKPVLLPSVDSMEPLWQDYRERAAVESKLGAAIVGSNATVKAGLEKLLGDTATDEVIVVTDTYEHADGYSRISGWPTLLGRSR